MLSQSLSSRRRQAQKRKRRRVFIQSILFCGCVCLVSLRTSARQSSCICLQEIHQAAATAPFRTGTVAIPAETDKDCVVLLPPELKRNNNSFLSNSIKSSATAVVPVFFLPDAEDDIGSEMGHFLLPGIKYSSRLRRIRKSPLLDRNQTKLKSLLAQAWVVEMGELNNKGPWCVGLTQAVQWTLQLYVRQQAHSPASTVVRVPGWNIHIFDWADSPWLEFCEDLLRIGVPRHNVYYHKRSLVSERRVKNDPYIEVNRGIVNTFGEWIRYSGRPVQSFPYAVRPDLLELISDIIDKDPMYANQTLSRDACGNVDLPRLERPYDVAHFWEDDGSDEARFRNKVNQVLGEMGNISTFAGRKGTIGHEGRQSASYAYAKSMLQFKIVVVCQRDGHEDHYRLMEALVSGAMVMTDVMLSLPEGLEDGKHLTLFSDDMEELQEKILHYLKAENAETRIKIARAGRQVALERHVPWRRMEDAILQADAPREILYDRTAVISGVNTSTAQAH